MGALFGIGSKGSSNQRQGWNPSAWPYASLGMNSAVQRLWPGAQYVPGQNGQPGTWNLDDASFAPYPGGDRTISPYTPDMQEARGLARAYVSSPLLPGYGDAMDWMRGNIRGDEIAALPHGLGAFQSQAPGMGAFGGVPSRTSVGRGSVSGIDQFTGPQASFEETLGRAPTISQALGESTSLEDIRAMSPTLRARMLELAGTQDGGMELPDYLKSELTYDWLDPNKNKFVRENYDAAAGAVTDQYKDATAPSTAAQFALNGAFGGTAQGDTEATQRYDFGRNLSELASKMYGDNYRAERQQYADAARTGTSVEMANEQSDDAERALMLQIYGTDEAGAQQAWAAERGDRAKSAAGERLQQAQQWAQERDRRLASGAAAGISELEANTNSGIAELQAATNLANTGMGLWGSNLHDWTTLYDAAANRQFQTAHAMPGYADAADQLLGRRVDAAANLGASDQAHTQAQADADFENTQRRAFYDQDMLDRYMNWTLGFMGPETYGTGRSSSSSPFGMY